MNSLEHVHHGGIGRDPGADTMMGKAASIPRALWCALAMCLVAGVGCTPLATAPELQGATAPQPAPPYAATSDGRARFRELFCTRIVNREGDAACDELLWHLRDESGGAIASEPRPPHAGALHYVVVTGAFGDCRWKHMLPFGPAIEQLVGRGYAIDSVVVGGRSSAAHNAAQIADALRRVPDERPLVLIGYSKGAVDILEFLAAYPEAAARVAGVVSVGGPILGSPLAEQAGKWLARLPDDAFASFCEPGDGGVFTSLLPATRRQWFAEHALPAHVRYFSIVAFPSGEHLSRGLHYPWRQLAAYDRRNDGQVVATDALIPGSTLLALVNADHWDLAIALDEQMPYFSSRPSGRSFPRDSLFEAILDYVGDELAAQPSGGPSLSTVKPEAVFSESTGASVTSIVEPGASSR